MRLSEKTLELSLVAQLSGRLGLTEGIWFGLTQKQERQLGFDAASNLGGRLVVFQFKASSIIVQPRRFPAPRRRFTVPHQQLLRLQELAEAFPDSVYYVLPNIGTWEELAENWNLVEQTYVLRVASLPTLYAAPDNVAQVHYAYIDPPECELRSKPHLSKLLDLAAFHDQLGAMEANARLMVDWIGEREFTFKGRKTYGLLLPSA